MEITIHALLPEAPKIDRGQTPNVVIMAIATSLLRERRWQRVDGSGTKMLLKELSSDPNFATDHPVTTPLFPLLSLFV